MLKYEEDFKEAECFLKTNEFMKTLDFDRLFEDFKHVLMAEGNYDINFASENKEDLNLLLQLQNKALKIKMNEALLQNEAMKIKLNELEKKQENRDFID